MGRGGYLKILFTVLPLTVLCMLYGLWLVLAPPAYLESALFGALLLTLFSVLFIRFIPDCFEAVLDQKHEQRDDSVRRIHRCGPRELVRTLFLLVLVRLFTMVLAFAISSKFFGYTDTFFNVQRLWANHGEAARYISLVNQGYGVETPGTPGQFLNLIYEPFYAYIIRLVSPFYKSSIRAAFFVSNLSAIIGGALLYLLALHDADRRTARRAIRYYSFLPPAFLLCCTIPASTFFALTLACLLAMRKKHFPLASLFGALAAFTETAGLALAVPLLMEYLGDLNGELRVVQQKDWRFYTRRTLEGLSILLIPLTFGAYLLINKSVSGSAFAFLEYYSQVFGSPFALFYRVGGSAMDSLIEAYRTYDTASLYGVWIPNVLALGLSLGILLGAQKKLRPAYVGYFMAYLLLCASRLNQLALPRMLYCCFPVLAGVTKLTSNRYVDIAVTILSLGGLAVYLGMYVYGWPVI